MSDLYKVEWMGDDNMSGFFGAWDDVLDRMQHRPGNDHLRDIMLTQLRKSKALQHQMELWDAMSDSDPNKSYQWLVDMLNRKIEQQRQRNNLKDLQVNAGKPVAAAVASEQPKGPKNCKYGANCTNGKCTFLHPPKGGPALVAAIPKKKAGQPQKTNPGAQEDTRDPCWAWVDGKCNLGGACSRAHRALTKEEKQKKAEAEKRRADAAAAKAKGGTNAGGGANVPPPPKRTFSPAPTGICANFKKAQTCQAGLDCRFAHEGLEKHQEAHRAARAAAKAKKEGPG